MYVTSAEEAIKATDGNQSRGLEEWRASAMNKDEQEKINALVNSYCRGHTPIFKDAARRAITDLLIDARLDEVTLFDTTYFTPYTTTEKNDDANTMFNEITNIYIEDRLAELRKLKSAGSEEV